MFKRILAPVDGSDAAARALDTASDLAVKCGAELL
ncbi:MAG: universal stress protein, partial [Alphaproteobacteria bacterium]|nr:universal stress protein [Alphaproteobacteria bacterium]